MKLQAPDFEGIVAGLAEVLAESIEFKYLTGLQYDARYTLARRVFTSAPQIFPAHEEKLFSDGPMMRFVSKGYPYRAHTEEQVKADYPDHARIFALGCGSLMNLPVTLSGQSVGQINLMHESGFYTANKLVRAHELTGAFLKHTATQSVLLAHLIEGADHA